MSAKGIVMAEELHFVNALPPIDINVSAQDSDVWSMGDAAHATIIVQLGVTGADTTVTIEECDDFTPSNSTAIAFSYYAERTAAGDTLGTRTAATTAGFATGTNDSIFFVAEVDASQLTDGFPNLRVALTDPGSATFANILVILSGIGYPQEQTATAIA